jgi:hypothetical protein
MINIIIILIMEVPVLNLYMITIIGVYILLVSVLFLSNKDKGY